MRSIYYPPALNGGSGDSRRGVPRSSIPKRPKLKNLNALLNDIYLRFISLDDEDFEWYYEVVHEAFRQLHYKMKGVDPYYARYSSTIQYAGSHPDRLRINKPDEFDIDIVIGLPLNYNCDPYDPEASDIQIEPKDPGFVQLRMGVQYQRLPKRDPHDWHINRTAYKWRDSRNYLLRSKCTNWFKGVVSRALNLLPRIYVDGIPYTISLERQSGPAVTLIIENSEQEFELNVDLVPALRFPITRWPISPSYRYIPPQCYGKNYFMVVPKVNKKGYTKHDENRSWRVTMNEQEAMLIHNTNNLRHTILLMKKFCDAQKMAKIVSYHIKTLFFWEIERNCNSFWNNSPAFLFHIMMEKFYEALIAGRIPDFWNPGHNLIYGVKERTLEGYAAKVAKLLRVLYDPSKFKHVARYLLTSREFRPYNYKFLHLPRMS